MTEKKEGGGGSAATAPNEEHPILERDLARDLGISLEEAKELRKRHLEAGEFALGKKGWCLSLGGAEKIRRVLGVEKKGPEKKEGAGGFAAGDETEFRGQGRSQTEFGNEGKLGTRGDEGASRELGDELAAVRAEVAVQELPWSERPIVELFVKKVPQNVRILIATADKDLAGPEVRVQVRSNANFCRKMGLKAKLERGSLYVFMGRLPRQRGRY